MSVAGGLHHIIGNTPLLFSCNEEICKKGVDIFHYDNHDRMLVHACNCEARMIKLNYYRGVHHSKRVGNLRHVDGWGNTGMSVFTFFPSLTNVPKKITANICLVI